MERCWNHDPRLRPEVSEALDALLNSENPAWRRLISTTLDTNGRTPLITTIFSDRDQIEMVEHLSGDDAQRFIDVTHEVLDTLAPRIRRRCLRSLYWICDRQALLPKSLETPLCYNINEYPRYHGGFADVWKGQHNDREVGCKVLRVYSQSELELVRRRFCREVVTWKALHHPNVLPLLGVTMSEIRFVMISEWMENGNIDMFVKAHTGANQLELLRDVTKGLIYMHGQGIIHGNIEKANILIGNDGHACLAGFSTFTIPLGRPMITFPAIGGGTIRWMSPELLNPGMFGLEESQPTKKSDCYALGMVIYEILSGKTPFAPYTTPTIIWKVLKGERPERPQGEEGRLFTDVIWGVLELCWKPLPRDRISAKTVLLGLEGNPPSLRPGSTVERDVGIDTDDQSDAAASDSGSLIGNSNNYPPDSSPGRPPGVSSPGTTGPQIAHNDNGLPLHPRDSPPVVTRPTTSNEGRNILMRTIQKVLKAATRKRRAPTGQVKPEDAPHN
ncbi:kinase-like protein [Thelephora ganbajun]|uniref:Kinase-like protein n=1 Tax=Thelephora ganbajun TaxID=370292 RepID=A0ACB6Z406_THEGA|nr:kinase-like protein [Thelephora ganbajun]